MKVLVVTQNYYPDQFIINDISKILSSKNEVHILTGYPDYKNGTISEEFKKNKEYYSKYGDIEIIRVPIIERKKGKIRRAINYLSFMISSSIWTLFNKNKYDLIFNFQTSPVTMSFSSLIHNKTKKMMYCLDLWPESVKAMNFTENSIVYRVSHLLSRYIYNKMDLICVSSNYFKEYLNTVNNVDKNKIVFLPQFEKINFIEDRINNEELLNIGFMGNVGLVQNIEYLVEISQKLPIKHKIHIIGSGSNLDNIKQLVKSNNLDNNFKFYGYVKKDSLKEIVKIFDICYLSLKVDNAIGKTIPYKFQGYLSYGKPVFSILDNEVNEIIKVNNLGLSYKSFEIDSIISDLVKFKSDEDLIHKVEENCKRYFLNNYTEEIFKNKLNEYINQTMEM